MSTEGSLLFTAIGLASFEAQRVSQRKNLALIGWGFKSLFDLRITAENTLRLLLTAPGSRPHRVQRSSRSPTRWSNARVSLLWCPVGGRDRL